MQYNSPHPANSEGTYSQIVSRALLIQALATSKHELVWRLAYICFLTHLKLECTWRKTVHYMVTLVSHGYKYRLPRSISI